MSHPNKIHAVPPTASGKSQYVPASKLSDEEIIAGLVDGSLSEWRVDAEGRRWLERIEARTIYGIPPTGRAATGADDNDNDESGDDFDDDVFESDSFDDEFSDDGFDDA
jgi:hypothetical protein